VDITTKPQSPALTLREFFSETYSVPDYQRFFAWGSEEIEQLFSDLQEFFHSDNPHYFMGQVIVSSSSSVEKYDLVDGQQRATALLLLLIAIRDRFEQHPEKETDLTLKMWLSELTLLLVWSSGESKVTPRVKVAGNGGELVSALLNRTDRPSIDGPTRENIVGAFEELTGRLEREFPDITDIPRLYRRLVDGVILVRLELKGHEEAIGVFERINNRGLPLTSADLIKNTLFAKVSNEDYETVSEDWQKTSEILYSTRRARITQIGYLLRAMLVGETGILTTDKALRDKWGERLTDRKSALQFASSLPIRATELKTINEGVCPSDRRVHDLNEGTKFFRFIQHYPILLAATRLNPISYEYLSRLLENRSMLSVLASERSQDFEKLVPGWSLAVRQLDEKCSIEEVFKASSDYLNELNNLLDRVDANIKTWRYTNQAERKRLRYVLARINRSQLIALKEPNVPKLLDYLRRPKSAGKKAHGYDLDHIRPQSKYGHFDLTHSIGNLAFVSEVDQRSCGDKEPIAKTSIYRHSLMVFTQSLASEPVAKKRRLESIERIRSLTPKNEPILSLTTWSDISIINLQHVYTEALKADFRQVLANPT
jgi:hypothetical protein